MPHTVTLSYDASLIREAALRFWSRTVGWGFGVAFVVVSVSLGALLLRGDRSWVVGVAASILMVGLTFMTGLYLVHYRNAISKFRELTSGQATLEATDSTLSLSSNLGSSTVPWSAVKEIWRFKRVWLLLFSKAQFVTLPVASISSELQAFILQRVQASGGKVA